jgi:hypothetical protein
LMLVGGVLNPPRPFKSTSIPDLVDIHIKPKIRP